MSGKHAFMITGCKILTGFFLTFFLDVNIDVNTNLYLNIKMCWLLFSSTAVLCVTRVACNLSNHSFFYEQQTKSKRSCRLGLTGVWEDEGLSTCEGDSECERSQGGVESLSTTLSSAALLSSPANFLLESLYKRDPPCFMHSLDAPHGRMSRHSEDILTLLLSSSNLQNWQRL